MQGGALDHASLITLEQANEEIAKAPFVSWWGLSVKSVEHGCASVLLPFRKDLLRPGDVLHGSSYEVASDVAMWVAIMTVVGVAPMAVTIEMKTSFFKGAKANLIAEAKVLKLGRRVTFGQAEVYSDGVLVAHSTLSYAMPANQGD